LSTITLTTDVSRVLVNDVTGAASSDMLPTSGLLGFDVRTVGQ